MERITEGFYDTALNEASDGGLALTDIFSRGQPSGTGSKLAGEAFKAAGIKPGQNVTVSKIENPQTLETLNSGGAAAESLLGRVVRNGLSQNGVGVRSMEFNVTPRGVNIQVSTK